MNRDEMMEELSNLKNFCIEMQKRSRSEIWKNGETVLDTAIEILDEYVNNVEHIRDMIMYLFIFVGLVAMLVLIIVCRM